MKALIVEDEPPAADKLRRMLAQIDSEIKVVGQADSVNDAAALLKEHSVDLIFLDIHLSDGLSFSLFDRIEENVPVIFTTAYDQYAIRAFKVNSVDYLLKPISIESLRSALEKFKKRHLPSGLDYQELLQALEDRKATYQKRFMVYRGSTLRSLKVENIAWFRTAGKHVVLCDRSGQEFLVDFTLDHLQSVLDPESFFRINRQYIVALEAIGEMENYSKGRLRLHLSPPPSDAEVVVSVDKAPLFKSWLNS